MKIGLVIPWRPTPTRLRPLQAVLEWYETNLPDIEIIYADKPGEFWSAAGSRNLGVRKAQEAGCDIVILNDADTLPELSSLLEAIDAAQSDGMIHNPYRICKYFDMRMSELFYADMNPEILKHTLYTEANGGVWVCTPQAWWVSASFKITMSQPASCAFLTPKLRLPAADQNSPGLSA